MFIPPLILITVVQINFLSRYKFKKYILRILLLAIRKWLDKLAWRVPNDL